MDDDVLSVGLREIERWIGRSQGGDTVDEGSLNQNEQLAVKVCVAILLKLLWNAIVAVSNWSDSDDAEQNGRRRRGSSKERWFRGRRRWWGRRKEVEAERKERRRKENSANDEVVTSL
jgi:hypothetical protein